jgi:hypothetical protein
MSYTTAVAVIAVLDALVIAGLAHLLWTPFRLDRRATRVRRPQLTIDVERELVPDLDLA